MVIEVYVYIQVQIRDVFFNGNVDNSVNQDVERNKVSIENIAEIRIIEELKEKAVIYVNDAETIEVEKDRITVFATILGIDHVTSIQVTEVIASSEDVSVVVNVEQRINLNQKRVKVIIDDKTKIEVVINVIKKIVVRKIHENVVVMVVKAAM